MKIEDAAIAVMRERKTRFCWYGNPDLVAEIYDRSGCKGAKHPLNRSAAVMRCLAVSKKFSYGGYINHLGRRYNLYEIKR